MQDAMVCATLIERTKNESVPLTKTGKAPEWKDFAILALTNESLEKAAFALSRRGIPYVVAGRGFYRAREVLDLAMLIDLLCDPSDRRALLSVLRGPLCAAHDTSLLGLTDEGRGLRRLDSTFLDGPRKHLIRATDAPRIALLCDVVVRLSRVLPALGPGETLRQAVAALSFEETLALMPRAAERIANVRKLQKIADREPDAEKLQRELRVAIDREMAEADAATFSDDDDAVRLLTVHVSKGLDFPIVLIPEAGALMAPRPSAAWLATLPVFDGGKPELTARFLDDETGRSLSAPSHERAKQIAERRDRAERQRLLYVAMTRASDRMFFVGMRKAPKVATREDTSMAASLASVAASHPEVLDVREEEVEELSALSEVADLGALREESLLSEEAPAISGKLTPRVRSLTIAPTALADFAHCPRRFFLAHDIGLPEFKKQKKAETTPGAFDARREGTLLHAVLERAPQSAFGSASAEAAAFAEVTRLGVPVDEEAHANLVARATRFLTSHYAHTIRERAATLLRESPFLLSAKGESTAPEVLLRGTMDLVVRFPDGETHVIDYKRARGPDVTPYAFQLDVYALATWDAFGVIPKTAVVFLGGKSQEPIFMEPRAPEVTRAHLAALGSKLAAARLANAFPRVPVETCHAIVCGYVGRCHPNATRA